MCFRSARAPSASSPATCIDQLREHHGVVRFESVHVAVAESPYELGPRGSEQLLTETGVDRDSIGLLISGVHPIPCRSRPNRCRIRRGSVCTMAGQVSGDATADDLELHNAWPFAIDQLACTTLARRRVSRDRCASRKVSNARSASRPSSSRPRGARGDLQLHVRRGLLAILIERNGTRNRLVSATNVTKGYYWDRRGTARRDRGVVFSDGGPCPAPHHRRRRVEPSDVELEIPHNVIARSWEILPVWCGCHAPASSPKNIARHGHTLSGDNFINYRDAIDGGCIQLASASFCFPTASVRIGPGIAVEA